MRLFIAINIPETIKDKVFGAIMPLRKVGADVRWVTPATFHLTLKFLGELDEERVPGVKDALSGLPFIADSVLKVAGAGAFPNLKNPRVLWIGVEDVSGNLARLQSELEDRLEFVGIPREGRRFQPHLTIGRIRSPRRIRELADRVNALKVLPFGEFPLEEIILFRSDLKPEGAVHAQIFKSRLESR